MSLQDRVEVFMKEMFESWYGQGHSARFRRQWRNPANQDFEELARCCQSERFGEYTLNSRMKDMVLSRAKIVIPDTSRFFGWLVHEVMRAMVEEIRTKKNLLLPGLEYDEYILRSKRKNNPLKDGNWYFFPGSLVRRSGGSWAVPYARWSGSSWYRRAHWLGGTWGSDCRVVLLEI